MRTLKLSLAAALSAAAFSSVATAISLDEAIKDVDLSGFAQYRYDAFVNKDFDSGANGGGHQAAHRFTTDLDFRVTLDDNFFGVIGFRHDSLDESGNHRTDADGNRLGITNVGANDIGGDEYGQTFNVRQIMLGYKAGNTTIQLGRQVLGTFFTDDMVGTGLKILNSDVDGLTLAAIAFDDLQGSDGDISSGELIVNGSHTYQNNLYGIAAIGSYDPVSFQLWYAVLDGVTDLYVADVVGSFELGDGISAGARAQIGGSRMDSDFKTGSSNIVGDADHWAVELSANAFGFDASAGYIDFSTDKDKSSLTSYEDVGEFIHVGENLIDYALFSGENRYWFVTAGYSFAEKFRVGADYVSGSHEVTAGKTDQTEVTARASYEYSKKLTFTSYWTFIDEEDKFASADGTNQERNKNHFRFQAKYTF